MESIVVFSFKLYVADEAANSAQALYNLRHLCRVHLADRYLIEVVDVLREPHRALADGIFMTPTLLRLTPSPLRRVVGTLSDTEALMVALNLPESSTWATV